MAKATLTHTRVNLVAAIMQHKEGEHSRVVDDATEETLPPERHNNAGTEWVGWAGQRGYLTLSLPPAAVSGAHLYRNDIFRTKVSSNAI